MKDQVKLTKAAIALLILTSLVIGMCIVLVGQSFQNNEPNLLIAFLGVSMVGLLKVIIGGSIRAYKKG